MAISMGAGTVEVRLLGAEAYMRGNKRFWEISSDTESEAQREKIVSTLANRWVKTTPQQAGVGDIVRELSPARLSRCVTRVQGTLSDGGRSEVAGERATVIVDAGDKPGTTPGRLYVAAEGPPLPLRVLQTGPQQPGGTRDPQCDTEGDSTRRQDLRLSRFNEPLKITAPQNAIELPAQPAGTDTTTSR